MWKVTRVAEEEDDEVIESSMEVFSFDENGQEIDASDSRFRRCGRWQLISESSTCEFVFRCFRRNQRGTVTRTVEQKQCKKGIQQKETTRIRCGC
jgi:hypothetical protein